MRSLLFLLIVPAALFCKQHYANHRHDRRRICMFRASKAGEGMEERERKSPGTCGEAYVVDNKNGN